MRRIQIILARNLKEEILKQYDTVEEFANGFRISKGWLYRVLNKKIDPSFTRVAKMADLLEIGLETLYPMKRKRR